MNRRSHVKEATRQDDGAMVVEKSRRQLPRPPGRAPWTRAMAYFVHDLDMRLPLADMLLSQLAKTFPEQVQVAAYVEPSSKEIT